MSDEEKYRCFIYAFTSKNKSSSDIQLAQSGDATCNGLLSPRDGSRTLTLSIGKNIFYYPIYSILRAIKKETVRYNLIRNIKNLV